MALDFVHSMFNVLIVLTLLRLLQVAIAARSQDNPFGNALSFILG